MKKTMLLRKLEDAMKHQDRQIELAKELLDHLRTRREELAHLHSRIGDSILIDDMLDKSRKKQ